MTKTDTAIAVGIGLVLLAGKKALASTSPKAAAHPDPDQDGANLVKRATQAKAMNWATYFVDHPTSPLVAAELARWAGIESSGDPLAHSRLNERGLMQAGAQTVDEGGLTGAEWNALIDPKTTKQQHADLAIKYVDWLWQRASRYVGNPPADPVDQIWYAKLYHQRPVDLKDHPMQGAAADMARDLADVWAADPKAMHRLRAANVVAWGTPTP